MSRKTPKYMASLIELPENESREIAAFIANARAALQSDCVTVIISAMPGKAQTFQLYARAPKP